MAGSSPTPARLLQEHGANVSTRQAQEKSTTHPFKPFLQCFLRRRTTTSATSDSQPRAGPSLIPTHPGPGSPGFFAAVFFFFGFGSPSGPSAALFFPFPLPLVVVAGAVAGAPDAAEGVGGAAGEGEMPEDEDDTCAAPPGGSEATGAAGRGAAAAAAG